jgi:replicative DNA helicase
MDNQQVRKTIRGNPSGGEPIPFPTARLVPSDINAERYCLGSILIERDAIIAVEPWLESTHFYLERHAWIYEAMLECYRSRPSIPPDIGMVSQMLQRHDRLEGVGGIAYLGELSAEVPTAVHCEYYGEIVRRTFRLRGLIRVGGEISAMGYEEDEDIETTLANAEQKLFAFTQQQQPVAVSGDDVAHALLHEIQQIKDQEHTPYIPTGFMDLDDKMHGGFQPGNLIILAARPSMGKTACALNIALNLLKNGHGVYFVSLEMGKEEIGKRMVSMITHMPFHTLQQRLDSEDEIKYINALADLSNFPLYIYDQGGQTGQQICSTIRAHAVRNPISMVVIDYLQLVYTDLRACL